MDVRYDISQLFDLAFGIKSPVFIPYPIEIGSSVDPSAAYPGITVKTREHPDAISWLGTPVLYQFRLVGKNYKTYNLTGQLTDHPLSDFLMPAATLVDFTRAKNIIRTQVLGNEGTVKELYGFDDWKVRIRGLCLDEPGRSARLQKAQLLQWERVCGSISVVGDLFREREITNLCISSVNFSQLEKQPNVFPFEIEAESDMAIELMFL